MTERTNPITNEVLEQITFVLALLRVYLLLINIRIGFQTIFTQMLYMNTVALTAMSYILAQPLEIFKSEHLSIKGFLPDHVCN